MHYRIKELPKDDRPYEKFLKYGVKALSDSELVAVFIKTGIQNKTSIDIAREVLLMPDGTTSLLSLHKKSIDELRQISGIGLVKALCLKCIVEISERIALSEYNSKVNFTSPKSIADYYMERFRHLNHEEFCVIFLDSNNRLITERVLTIGTINQSIVSVREVFINALDLKALRIVLLHNHPSGNCEPSMDDIMTTKALYKAGQLLNIEVLDHLIIGDRNYLSFKECNLFSDYDID